MANNRQSSLLKEIKNKLISRYKVSSVIGSGGMGAVFKAVDQKSGKTVALKILHPELSIDQESVKRFLRESKLAAKLKHPNIIRVYGSGRSNGYYYIAMEYLKGKSLDQFLAKKKKLEVRTFLLIAEKTIKALEAAHKKGIIHRDIKPSNIFIGKDNHVTLLDFGIGRAIEKTTLTKTGLLIGTPQYISPEQAQGKKATSLSDIYSLGIVFFQSLTGKALFEADTPVAVLHKHIHEPIPRMREISDSIPEQLELIISKMLSKNPQQRYSSASELYKDLISYQKNKPLIASKSLSEADTVNLKTSLTQPKNKHKKKWLVLSAVGAAVLIGGTAIGLTMLEKAPVINQPQKISKNPNVNSTGESKKQAVGKAKSTTSGIRRIKVDDFLEDGFVYKSDKIVYSDFNSDGIEDAALAYKFDSGTYPNRWRYLKVKIIEWDGTKYKAKWQSGTLSLYEGEKIDSLQAKDVNGDGTPEIIVTLNESNALYIFSYIKSDKTYDQIADLAVNDRIVVKDIDKDGLLEIQAIQTEPLTPDTALQDITIYKWSKKKETFVPWRESKKKILAHSKW